MINTQRIAVFSSLGVACISALYVSAVSQTRADTLDPEVASLTQQIAIKPSARLYGLRALCYKKGKMYSKALEDIEMALREQPNYVLFHCFRSEVLNKLGRFMDSTSESNYVLRLSNPNDTSYATALAERAYSEHMLHKDAQAASDTKLLEEIEKQQSQTQHSGKIQK